MEEIFKQKRDNQCHLEVREDNKAALKLYENSGYKRMGILEKYYDNKHGLYLKKDLWKSVTPISSSHHA
jgi:ribosomal protein S18 acetylase RimI-like enzyme